MLKIEKTVLPSPEQWDAIIRGMRNPMNSWEKSDSYAAYIEDPDMLEHAAFEFFLGENDHQLMMNLAKGGSVHAKYRRMITVICDITAPLYWWKEFDTYKVGTVTNSCSTMHKIHFKDLILDDFSHEHLDGWCKACLENTIDYLNKYRHDYCETKCKGDWWQMIQLLPTSYNQKRTAMLNYEVLVAMYRDRKDHKLDEWHTFCDWIRGLPYSELIVGDG